MWASLIGAGLKNADAPIKAIGNALDGLFTSDEERKQCEALLMKLRQHPGELQVELNKIEAQHRSIFVAGWRPFIGWICGCALAWHFILYDLLMWISSVRGWLSPPELVGTSELISVVFALLGLGGLRTFEKVKGKTK